MEVLSPWEASRPVPVPKDDEYAYQLGETFTPTAVGDTEFVTEAGPSGWAAASANHGLVGVKRLKRKIPVPRFPVPLLDSNKLLEPRIAIRLHV